MNWKKSNPVYPVSSVVSAIEWYREMFGFEPVHLNPAPGGPNYAVLYRNGVSIHLVCQDEAEHGLRSPVQASSGSTADWMSSSTK